MKNKTSFNKMIKNAVGLACALCLLSTSSYAGVSSIHSKYHKVIVSHEKDQSFMEAWNGLDVSLFSRKNASDMWKPVRYWPNMSSGRVYGQEGRDFFYSTQQGDQFELIAADTYQTVYRIKHIALKGKFPNVFYGHNKSKTTILRMPVEINGRIVYQLHIAKDGTHWKRWNNALVQGEVTNFIELRPGTFAIEKRNKGWTISTLTSGGALKRLLVPGLPFHIETIRWLGEFAFATGKFDTSLYGVGGEKRKWKVFGWSPKKKWHSIQRVSGLKPEKIQKMLHHGDHILELMIRNKKTSESKKNKVYMGLNAQGEFQPLHQVMKGLPPRIGIIKSLADDTLLGIREADDSDGNGTPGSWVWRMRSASGVWKNVDDVLQGAPGKIWDVSAWLKGIGIQEYGDANQDGKHYTWSWYLSDEDGAWRPLTDVLPASKKLSLVSIRYRRDGLIEAIQDESAPADIHSHISVNTQRSLWWIQTQDGQWSSVRALIKRFRGSDRSILAVDARKNALLVDVQENAKSPKERYLLYRNRDHHWVLFAGRGTR